MAKSFITVAACPRVFQEPRGNSKTVRNEERGNEMILKTGDIGYKDADGFLYFVSRNDSG